MSSIDEYFGFNEPNKKVEPEQKSLSDRSKGMSDGMLRLNKTSEYFEEAYNLIEPEPIQEEFIIERNDYPQAPDLSDLSIEELEALAEEKSKEIEIDKIKSIAAQGIPEAWVASETGMTTEHAESYVDRFRQVLKAEEPEEGVDIQEKRFADMERRIVALSNTMEGVKGYINEGTLVSGIGQGGDGQLPGGGEVLLRRLDDVNLEGIQDGDSIVWSEIDGQFLPGAGGGAGGDFLPRDGSKPMEGQLSIIYDTQNPLNRGLPALSIKDTLTSVNEFAIDYQGAFIRDFSDPSFEYNPPTRNYLANKGYVDDEIQKANLSILTFKGTKDCTIEDPDQPINNGDVYEHTGPSGTTTVAWGAQQIEPADFIAFEGRDWVIITPEGDLYVKKGGDVMTGALKLQTNGGQPQTPSHDDEAVNKKHVDDNFLDVKGGTLTGATFNYRRQASTADFAADQDDDSDLRFVTINTRIAKNTDTGGTEDSSTRRRYGIRFKLDDGNSFKNTLAVNNRDNRFIQISGGVDPSISFNTNLINSNWDPSIQDKMDRAGVMIFGIPTPGPGADETSAVNKKYVDENFISVSGDSIVTGHIYLAAPGAYIAHAIDYGTTSQPSTGAKLLDVVDTGDNNRLRYEVTAFRFHSKSSGKDVNTVNHQLYFDSTKNEEPSFYFKSKETSTDTNKQLFIIKNELIDIFTDVDMHYKRITYTSDPIDGRDAATKDYADKKLAKSGGTMTGDIAMAGHKITNLPLPDGDQQPATKKYVDDLVSGSSGTGVYLPVDGTGKMESVLNMDYNRIKNLAAPTQDKDAATKEYVDTHTRIGRGFRIQFTDVNPSEGKMYQSDITTGTGRTFTFHKTDADKHMFNLASGSITDGPFYGVGRGATGDCFCVFKTSEVRRKDAYRLEAVNCEIIYQQSISANALVYWNFNPFW